MAITIFASSLRPLGPNENPRLPAALIADSRILRREAWNNFARCAARALESSSGRPFAYSVR